MSQFLIDKVMPMLVATMFVAVGCTGETSDAGDEHAAGGDHDDHGHGEETARGPKGGRLFETANVRLEIRIEEEEGPPVFIAYLYDAKGDPLPPEGAMLHVTLQRFANRTDVISFEPIGNHLRGDSEVREPHSVKAASELQYGGERHEFGFEQHEFRVDLSQAAVERADIVAEPAGQARIDMRVNSPGEVRLNRERVLIVRPRFAGVVTKMGKRLGDPVKEGEVLAVIQSNTSLTEYNITASMAGHIVARNGMVGSAVDQQSVLYTVADLSSVWVDFAIYPQHVGVIKRGQLATITAATRSELVAEGEVSYVGPLLEEDTRVSQGRILLPNNDGNWQPGLYVNVSAIVDHAEVAVAVPDMAIVRSKFGPAVFVADGSSFEIQPVVTGRSDGVLTEIVDGLNAGDLVVTKNAYLLKAELGRGEATHDH